MHDPPLQNPADTGETADAEPGAPRRRRNGAAFVYVLPCVHDDILKLGHSQDPLRRMRAFRRRYFDFFDLDAAFLLPTDRVAEALALERRLAQRIDAHRAVSPVRVARRAAGHTEWFRGALPALDAACRAVERDDGYRRQPLRTWLQARLRERADLVFDWSALQHAAMRAAGHAGDPALAAAVARVLADALDEFAAVGFDLAPRLPDEVATWYRRRRDAG